MFFTQLWWLGHTLAICLYYATYLVLFMSSKQQRPTAIHRFQFQFPIRQGGLPISYNHTTFFLPRFLGRGPRFYRELPITFLPLFPTPSFANYSLCWEGSSRCKSRHVNISRILFIFLECSIIFLIFYEAGARVYLCPYLYYYYYYSFFSIEFVNFSLTVMVL